MFNIWNFRTLLSVWKTTPLGAKYLVFVSSRSLKIRELSFLTSCLILVSLILLLVKIGEGIVLMLLVYSHGIRVLSLVCYSSD